MAIYKIHNIVESVRAARCPFWKVYRSVVDRSAGNYICSADFDNPELGIEASCEHLRNMLKMQTPGRYVLAAYKRNTDNKGGLGADIEIEYEDNNIKIAAIGNTEPAVKYIDGIGAVTLDNIDEVIDKKIKLNAAKQAEEARIKAMEAENARLKDELRENETGLNKGIMAIGSIVWGKVRGTPLGQEVIGMFSQIKKATAEQESKVVNMHEHTNTDTVDASISGTEDAPPEMINALTDLSNNNPDLVNQLVMLAKVKKEQPDLFKDAIENLKLIAG